MTSCLGELVEKGGKDQDVADMVPVPKAGLVWRLCIDMDSVIKRPYEPNLELTTRPGKLSSNDENAENQLKVPQIVPPHSLCVVLRSKDNFCYAIEGIRLPSGVDPRSLQSYWRSSDQHLVIWASCTEQTQQLAPAQLLISGVSIMNSGFEANYEGPKSGQMHGLLYSAKRMELKAGIPDREEQIQAIFNGGRTPVRWNFNCIRMKPECFESEVVEAEKATQMELADRKASKEMEEEVENGEQYWFRNPGIEIVHEGGANKEKKHVESCSQQKEGEGKEEGELEDEA